MAYTDVGSGGANDTDIFARRSFNDGGVWSARVEVTDEVGINSQFLPQIAVDQTTGFVGVSWYDARFDNGQNDGVDDNDGVANNEANFFASISTDGGLTFLPNVSLTPFGSSATVAAVGNFNFGDYSGVSFFGGVLRPVWGDNSNSTGDNPAGRLSTLDLYTTGVTVTPGVCLLLTVLEGSGDDTVRIQLDPSGTFVQIFENPILDVNGIPIGLPAFTAPKATVCQINVLTDGLTPELGGGNDTLIIDSRNGLVNVRDGIHYDGGFGFDRLNLLQTAGGSASATVHTSDTYSVGPNPGEGTSSIDDGGTPQRVFFENLAPVVDLVPAATLTVNATPESNAINYTQGSVAANGLVTVDNYESIEFSNKDNLVINAGAGSDETNLNNPTTPAGATPGGLKTITVNGGDPTASDTLIVNGTAGDDDINFAPTSANAGTVTGAGPVPISAATVEHLHINLQTGANDSLTVTTPVGPDVIEFTPGTPGDTGTVAIHRISTGPLLGLTFSNLVGFFFGSGLKFANTGGTRQDDLIYYGRDFSPGGDAFAVNGSSDTIDFFPAVGGAVLAPEVSTFGIDDLTLKTFAGDDSFDISGALAYTFLTLDAGDGSDRVLLQATPTGPIVVTQSTVSGYGPNILRNAGVERLDLSVGGQALTVLGNGVMTYLPTGANAGTVTIEGQDPVVNFSGVVGSFTASTSSVQPGDELRVLGTSGNDTVTSTANTITVNGNQAVTIGSGFEKLTLSTLEGNDNITFSVTTAGIQKVIDAGAGNDVVNASLASDPTILGGDGDDSLTGSPTGDFIDGGRGNDTINGGGGADTVYAGEGNDSITGGTGDDAIFAGDGSDTIVWATGDGNDRAEGEDGTDELSFSSTTGTMSVGSAGATGIRVSIGDGVGGLSMAGVERIFMSGAAGADTVTVGDLSVTEVRMVGIDIAGGANSVTVAGRRVADDLTITVPSAVVTVTGLSYDVRIQSAAGGDDTLTVNGNEGDDHIKAESGVEGTMRLSLNGGAGDDFLSADATLIGGPGNDFLEGGAGADSLVGDAGEDTLVGGAGNDTIDGGADFDTILIRGTSGDDSIFVDQTSATSLSVRLNGVDDTDTLVTGTVEQAQVEAGQGDDTIAVRVSETLNATPANSLRVTVHGGEPNASDRLAVVDDGIGNLIISREAPDRRSGSITVGPLAPVVYDGVEFYEITPLDPVTGGTGTDGAGQIVVFDTDPFENNNSRRNATVIDPVCFTTAQPEPGGICPLADGAAAPNIDPAGSSITAPGGGSVTLAGDEDWYLFRSPKIGTFRFSVFFEEISTLANGQPGLPGNGTLAIDVFNESGTFIASGVAFGGAEEFSRGLQATFSAAADNSYFLRVRGATSDVINIYDVNLVEVDLLGPQVTGVAITGSAFDLFDPKPSSDGPTPLVTSLTISLRDLLTRTLTTRAPGDVYSALDATVAATPGHYRLVGDQTGVVPIANIVVTNPTPAADTLATATVELQFATPLPDDRYTLTILDTLLDPAGNKLDGESNGIEPQEVPSFLVNGFSGDGVSGGDFVARFTVDSRPEIGTFCCGSWYIDLNGNGKFDVDNTDATNRDIVYKFGSPGDFPVVGSWDQNGPAAGGTTTDGFDRIGVYGRRSIAGVSGFAFELDSNGNGTFDSSDDEFLFGKGGKPIAGHWPGAGVGNDDRVGAFDGKTWFIDRDGDHVPDVIPTNFRGRPIAGDWTGPAGYPGTECAGQTSCDRVGTFRDNTFFLDIDGDFQFDPAVDETITFGFNTPKQLPVAADWDADGESNIGLFVQDRNGMFPREAAEWYLDNGPPFTGPLGPTLSNLFGTPGGGSTLGVAGDGFFQPPPTGGLGR